MIASLGRWLECCRWPTVDLLSKADSLDLEGTGMENSKQTVTLSITPSIKFKLLHRTESKLEPHRQVMKWKIQICKPFEQFQTISNNKLRLQSMRRDQLISIPNWFSSSNFEVLTQNIWEMFDKKATLTKMLQSGLLSRTIHCVIARDLTKVVRLFEKEKLKKLWNPNDWFRSLRSKNWIWTSVLNLSWNLNSKSAKAQSEKAPNWD